MRQSGRAALRTMVFAALAILAGCAATTTLVSGGNLSGAAPHAWQDYDGLPIVVTGSVPAYDAPSLAYVFSHGATRRSAFAGPRDDLAAIRRMVLVVNAVQAPSSGSLCAFRNGVAPAAQQGQSARVIGALCDGPRVITWASADVRTLGASPDQLRANFRIVRDQLFYALFPGANDPDRYSEGY